MRPDGGDVGRGDAAGGDAAGGDVRRDDRAPGAAAPDAPVVAERDDAVRATIVRRLPLRYADGADPALDRPAHVRAGSALARVGRRLVVVQDDAHFLALVRPRDGHAAAVTLPAGPDGRRLFDASRGTKRHKLDLEACVALPGPDGTTRLLVVGSGSTPVRERIVVATFAVPVDGGGEPAGASGAAVSDAAVSDAAVSDAAVSDAASDALPGAPDDDATPPLVGAPAVVDARALYATLRATAAFAGAELNVEGAVRVPAADGALRVRLLARGNGAARTDDDGSVVEAVNATGDVDAAALLAFLDGAGPAPALGRVRAYRLGAIDDCALGFTDGAWLADGTLCYTAAAEASPNAVDDGAVAGSAIGWIAPDGASARWTPLREADGAVCREKVEGVVPATPDGARLWVVTDADDPDAPSLLCEVVVTRDG